MIISERFKENVKWMCGSKGVKYSKVEEVCHLPYGSIGSNYKFGLDDAYYIAQFFNSTVDDLMSNDYYTAALHKRIEELENELAGLQAIRDSLISDDIGLPQVNKTIDDCVYKKHSKKRKPMRYLPNHGVADFIDAGFFEITNNTNDYIPTRDIYKVYSEVSTNPVHHTLFGRSVRAIIPCNADKSLKRTIMINGKSTSIIYGIKAIDK